MKMKIAYVAVVDTDDPDLYAGWPVPQPDTRTFLLRDGSAAQIEAYTRFVAEHAARIRKVGG